MLTLTMRTGTLPVVERDLFANFVASLPAGFAPVLKAAVDLQAKAFGLPPQQPRFAVEGAYGGPSRDRIFVEVLATEHGVVTLDVAETSRRFSPTAEEAGAPGESLDVWVTGIGQPGIETAVADLCKRFSEQFDIALGEFSYGADRFGELQAEGIERAGPATVAELAGARLLCEPPARAIATAIAASGGLLAGDAARQLGESEEPAARAATESLQQAGLVESEIVVICRRTSRQVARVPSAETLEEMHRHGVRCACGADIAQERAEASLTITSTGRQLLHGCRWLAIMLIDALGALGVRPESILIENQDGGARTGCVADVGGELVLFELADKEFSLGDAYALGAKIGAYRPAHSVIVTSGQVGSDAKEHFQRARLSAVEDDFWYGRRGATRPVVCVEGLEQMRPSLETLVSSIHARDAERILSELLPSASLDAGTLVAAILQRPGATGRPAEDVRPPEPAPRTLRIRSTTASTPETLQWET